MRDDIFMLLHQHLSNGADLALLLGDLGVFQARLLFKDFPDRIFNLGILEPSMISFAAGLSKGGTTSVVYSITPFITERSLEQIKLDICYNKNKVILLSAGGTCDYTDLGPTHHCPSDISIIDNYPSISWFLPFTSEQSVLITDNSLSNTFSNSSYIRLSNTPFSQIVDSFAETPYFFAKDACSSDKQYTSYCIELGPDSTCLPLDDFAPDCHFLASSSADLSLILDYLSSLSNTLHVKLRCPFVPPVSVFAFINLLKSHSHVCSVHLTFSSSIFYDEVVNKYSYYAGSCQTLSF